MPLIVEKLRAIQRNSDYKAVNHKFTVEEINLISIFESKSRAKVMQDVSNAMKHLDDEDMIELSLRVVEKLKGMSEKEFAEGVLEPAE